MMLLSCSTKVKLHDSSDYKLAYEYKTSDTAGLIQTVSWCKDGSWFVMVPHSGNAEIIRTKDDCRLLQSVLGVPRPLYAAFQRSTKKLLAMSTKNGAVIVYDIKQRRIVHEFKTSGTEVTMLDWSLKDTHLATGDKTGKVTVYSNTSCVKYLDLQIPNSRTVSTLQFHKNYRILLGGASDEGMVVVWDVYRGKKKFMNQGHTAPVHDLAFSSQNINLLTSVGLDRTIKCYDINRGGSVLEVLTDLPLSSIDINPDGHTIAVGSIRGHIYIYDLRQFKQPVSTIKDHNDKEIKCVVYQPQPTTVGTVDILDITEENTAVSETTTDTHITDSFVQLISNLNNFSPVSSSRLDTAENNNTSTSGADSFLIAMGLDAIKKIESSLPTDKSELSNLGITEGVKKWIDSKLTQDTNQLNNPDIKVTSPSSNRKASTPLPAESNVFSFVENATKPEISPVLGESSIKGANVDELQNCIRLEIKDQILDLRDDLNQYFLNVQMSICKQFLNLEEFIAGKLDARTGEFNSNYFYQEQLKQLQNENAFLRNKINELLTDQKK